MSRISGFGALLAGVTLASCGYRSAVPTFEAVRVAAVTTRAPEPELAACLTAELREGLALRGVAVTGRPALRLEGELLEATAAPGTIAARDGLEPVDQALGVSLRVRLVHADRGVLWGPVVYRVEVNAAEGPGPLESVSSARRGYESACRSVAERVLDDLSEVGEGG